MVIRLCSGLGREITAYHSSVVPRVQECVSLAVGSDQAMYKVINVRYLVDGERGEVVDLEVLPVNAAAAQYSSEKFYQIS